jgi:hypothetical protein
MKRYLPYGFLLLGILVFVGVYFFVIRKPKVSEKIVEEDSSSMIEVSLEDSPVASLTPRTDGHWLDLKVTNIGKFDADSVDYELIYKLPDGRTQGVPGTVSLSKITDGVLERELLLGSESSGNFRYDKGVEGGSFSLRFRNEKGRLVAKFTTDFTLQTNTDELTSSDGNFLYSLDSVSRDYFVVMKTFGKYNESSALVVQGEYAIFSSSLDS